MRLGLANGVWRSRHLGGIRERKRLNAEWKAFTIAYDNMC